ncbi:hypothetical protein I316_05102 [Kwoniella heveanensis BCC8398]|uniref:Uncharacterized protein n=1 Tax=Kwoniella heveanensis BCC8398 TaxID=1296120 RepID=A0A1B9GQL2_9TREE|nr:hypothetical protein I316_05102 [Kwoniella heveanensis BCC8398]
MFDPTAEVTSGRSTPTKRYHPSTPTDDHPTKRLHKGTSTSDVLSASTSSSLPSVHYASADEREDEEEQYDQVSASNSRRDRGKGKMVYLPELPADVWTKIFEFYYEDLTNEWQASAAIRGGATPLLICRDLTSIALPVLYQHPYIGYNAIERFVAALSRTSGKARGCIRHLTIRASPLVPSKQFAAFHEARSLTREAENTRAVHNVVPYTIHPSFVHLMSLLPELTSFTLKDSLVLHQADAQLLFAGLRFVCPRKIRLEIRMWDLNDSPVGQDIMAATKGHSFTSTVSGRIIETTPPDPPSHFNFLDPMSGVIASWREALYKDKELDLPIWWTETPTFNHPPQPPQPPPSPLFGPAINQYIINSLSSGTLWPFDAPDHLTNTSTHASVLPEWRLFTDSPPAQAGSSLNLNNDWSDSLSQPCVWGGLTAHPALAIPSAKDASTHVVPASGSSGHAGPSTSATGQHVTHLRGAPPEAEQHRYHELSHIANQSTLPPGHTSRSDAAGNPLRLGVARDIDSNLSSDDDFGLLDDDISLIEDDFSNNAIDDNDDDDGDRTSELSETLAAPASATTSGNNSVSADQIQPIPNPTTRWARRANAIRASRAASSSASRFAAEDGPVPASSSMLVYGPQNISAVSSTVTSSLPASNRSLRRNVIGSRNALVQPVPPSVIGGVRVTTSQGFHSHALARYMGGLLLVLIRDRWTPRLQALSFVAHDPLASIIVRAPELNFWTQIPVPHIRVHLPRGCNSLAVFKGPRELARDRLRASRAEANHGQAQGQGQQLLQTAFTMMLNGMHPTPLANAGDQHQINEAELDRIGVVGGDGSGGGLIDEEVRLFEIEINTLAEMKDDVWIRCGNQLPPQLCRILAGEHDWRDVSFSHANDTYSPPHSEYVPPASPDTSDFDSPTFSFVSLSDDGNPGDEMEPLDLDRREEEEDGEEAGDDGEGYDEEKAKAQARLIADRKRAQ